MAKAKDKDKNKNQAPALGGNNPVAQPDPGQNQWQLGPQPVYHPDPGNGGGLSQQRVAPVVLGSGGSNNGGGGTAAPSGSMGVSGTWTNPAASVAPVPEAPASNPNSGVTYGPGGPGGADYPDSSAAPLNSTNANPAASVPQVPEAPSSNSGGVTYGPGGPGGADYTNSSSTGPAAASYTVQSGDTLSQIAAAHNMTTAQLIALNPQITNPNLIMPGQAINMGTGMGPGGLGNAGSGAVATAGNNGFPTTSSYPASSTNAQAGQSNGEIPHAKHGWGGGMGDNSKDPAQVATYVDTKQNTDPLNINDKKNFKA